MKCTMTCIPTARQRLGKQNSAEANACNSRTSIARQRNSKHASLMIRAVFSVGACKVVIKKSSEAGRSSIELVNVEN
jgi:hypothetical protein